MQDSSSNNAAVRGNVYSSFSQSAQDAQYADLFTLKCEAGFFVLGLREGEAVCTPVRVVATLVTMSVASAWFSGRKSIKKLLLFFSHWLRYTSPCFVSSFIIRTEYYSSTTSKYRRSSPHSPNNDACVSHLSSVCFTDKMEEPLIERIK